MEAVRKGMMLAEGQNLTWVVVRLLQDSPDSPNWRLSSASTASSTPPASNRHSLADDREHATDNSDNSSNC